MPSHTLVLQSHQHPLPHNWLQPCVDSVRHWSHLKGYDYHWMGDDLFDPVDQDILDKTAQQPVIATDLARLLQLRFFLNRGYKRVIWCDADFLVMNAEAFNLIDADFAVGREVWVEQQQRKIKSWRKVHNAFLMFCQGNAFLDFYIDASIRLLRQNQGPMPPQFIGPKLLTALHNVVQCPVQEDAGMLSPDVITDLLTGNRKSLNCLLEKQPQIHAANLCSSSVEKQLIDNQQMDRLLSKIKTAGNIAGSSM